jgi:hypothetical protein
MLMVRFTRPLYLLLLCCISFTNSKAQIVNVESARIQSDTTGWLGSVAASLSLTKNTQQVFAAEAGAHLQYKTKKSLYLILANYGFLKSADSKLIDNAFLHFRYNYKINRTIRWEAFTQVQNNLVTKIKSRFLIGTGPRFKIISTKVFRFYAASLLMFEAEKETGVDKLQENLRQSTYASFSIYPSNRIEIISTTFYQPKWGQFSDYRILNQSSLKVKASKKLTLTTNYNYLLDSHPAAGIPETNYNLSTGFEYDF